MLNWLQKKFSAVGKLGQARIQAAGVDERLPTTEQSNESSAHELKRSGNEMLGQGKFEDAAAFYIQALAIAPDDADLYINLGFVLIEQKRYADAKPYLEQAIALNSKSADGLYMLGIISREQGELTGAIASFEQALAIRPDFEMVYQELCHVLFTCGRAERAKQVIMKGIALYPESANFHYYLGNLYVSEREIDQAIQCYERALSLQPDYAEVHSNLGIALQEQGRLNEAAACYRRALLLQPRNSLAQDNLLFCLNYHPDMSAEAIFAEYRNWNALCALPLTSERCESPNDRSPTRRLRIGYVSPDLRQHAARHFIEPLLAHHDKSRVEVFAYAEVAIADSVTARLKTYFDHWRDTVGLSDDQMAETIRHDQIDILVDLAGHTANNRLLVFARRSAPIQVSWMGYGYTTGLDAMDYLVADNVFAPPGSESFFSEKLMRLPVWAVYRPDDDMGEPGPLPALNAQRVTFGSLSRSVRINYRVIRVWASILRRVPTADLVINSGSFRTVEMQTAMRDHFVAHGIAPERVIVGFDSPAWHVLQKIDIGLDCFPHNSGTTLFESLHMGVPFITLADRPSVGRIGASILTAVGYPEWIADSEDDYVEKAVALAADTGALALLRSGLRTQMKASRLMNESAFAASVEDAYRTAWQQWSRDEISSFDMNQDICTGK